MRGNPIRRLVSASFAIAAALAFAPSIRAEEAKPTKKDSPAFIRPKEVKLAASVTPAEAKPGESVTYTLTAKVAKPWHIYAYAKDQPDEGPKVTQFDFFGTDGLKAEGDWTPSREPISKKEPAFPELDKVSFYEDEVSWSLKLQVPEGAEPGEKSLACQISYQICNESSCKPPVRITTPSVKLTVLRGGGAAPKAKAAAIKTGAPPRTPDQAQNPKQVRFSTTIKPAQAKAGDRVSLEVTAKLDPGWHIFTVAPTEGPGQNTTFDLFDPAGLIPAGDWTASKEPNVKPDLSGLTSQPLEYFEEEVTWSLPLQVPADAQPGEHAIRNQVQFQVCSDQFCNRGRLTLPDVVLTVLPGGSPAPPAEVAAAPPAPEAAPLQPEPPAVEKSESAPAPAAPRSEVEQKVEQGLLPFLLFSAGAGVLALVMPCVWPMVPITVNFFVKQGHARGGSGTTKLAITYCLSIIGIFTLVGILLSALVGATAGQDIATNGWLNAFIAAILIVFGLSLLGLFEIRLPNFLLNASAQNEGRGGLVGVMFMALTLTITSFTCTAPVVGGLLVMASRGSYLYPVLGLATFATVVALPFFLLALAPGLLQKLPRGGDWMNAVKVVGGLIEIGAAFKFVNNAEIGFGTFAEDAWFNAPTVLTIWVVLSLVSGIYLLGLFRTDHDHDAVKVGPGRLIFGSMFLVLALFLMPALFGHPPRSIIWGRLIAASLPPDLESLEGAPAVAPGPAGEGAALARSVKATSSDPEEAVRQQKNAHGVLWGMSLEAAQEEAKARNKPVLIDFTGVLCTNCRNMEAFVMPRGEVVALLKEFVPVQLYTDKMPIKSIAKDVGEELAAKNQKRQYDLVHDTANPYYVALSPDGKILAVQGGASEPPVFVKFLEKALKAHQGGGEVARANGPTGR